MKRTVKINAKLNLNLQVLGISGRYHILDSVMVAINICDYCTIKQRTDGIISVSGTNIPNEQNTAYKSAELFQQYFDTNGFDIDIQKGIPMCSGLGGSSADGAGVLVALADMYNVDTKSAEFLQICADVGSDVTFMTGQGIGRTTDRGTTVQYTQYNKQLHFVVTSFGMDMSTAKVFSEWDRLFCATKQGDGRLFESIQNNLDIDRSLLVNDLQPVVCSMSNYAKHYLELIEQNNLHTCMTGSGSAFFVLANDLQHAECLCQLLKKEGFDSVVASSCDRCVELI